MAFLHTTGDFLVEAEFDGLYQFLVNGGSWLGIHSGPSLLSCRLLIKTFPLLTKSNIAADFWNATPPWYTTLVGSQVSIYSVENIQYSC